VRGCARRSRYPPAHRHPAHCGHRFCRARTGETVRPLTRPSDRRNRRFRVHLDTSSLSCRARDRSITSSDVARCGFPAAGPIRRCTRRGQHTVANHSHRAGQHSARHRRRRTNASVRSAFDEARAAGLVQRHLMRLHHVAARAARHRDHADPAPDAAVTSPPPSGERDRAEAA